MRGFGDDGEHLIGIAGSKNRGDVLRQLLCNALFLAHALTKQIFAYQLDDRGCDNRKGGDDNQQIGDYEFPAQGMEQAFNPCQ